METNHIMGHVGWSPDYKSTPKPPVTGKLIARRSAADCSALAVKWGKQAEMLRAQKKDFVERGYSSSLIQLWDTVAGVLNDCKTELEEAISAQHVAGHATGPNEPRKS